MLQGTPGNATCFYFHKEAVSIRLPNRAFLDKWLRLIFASEDKTPGTIGYIYCCDDYLRKINRKYLSNNSLTDVIAFGYEDGERISGDIFISIDRVRDNAIHYREPLSTELARVMVHGLLHLLGYRDKTPKDKEAMTAREDLYLSLRT